MTLAIILSSVHQSRDRDVLTPPISSIILFPVLILRTLWYLSVYRTTVNDHCVYDSRRPLKILST